MLLYTVRGRTEATVSHGLVFSFLCCGLASNCGRKGNKKLAKASAGTALCCYGVEGSYRLLVFHYAFLCFKGHLPHCDVTSGAVIMGRYFLLTWCSATLIVLVLWRGEVQATGTYFATVKYKLGLRSLVHGFV